MGELRCSFKCAECGGEKLRLMGFEILSIAVSFEVEFGGPEAGSDDWNVEYTLPKDGPRALIICGKCRHEVKVACRSEGGKTAVLWPAELYQMLWGALGIYGIQDEAFKGKAEVDWKKFTARLVAARPLLGKGRARMKRGG